MSLLETENVYLFIPNLIGYARIILAVISFYFMPTNYVISSWCYIISVLLDALDGHAARKYNQSTKFGAMLDQLTDRCGTMGLLVTLSYFYPKYMFWFQLSMSVDVACHWFYLHTTILQGKTSHKFIDMNENPIMHIYYTNRKVLGFMCLFNELFYAALYLLYFTPGPTFLGISLFKLIALVSAPVAIVKTLISIIHGIVASVNITTIDTKEREAAKKVNDGKKAE
ncbi:CLUMA_CG005200, isoform A [Clunio marinus]|uniref:CDP-diacylglycerol--inositol 3-phosphatidyltransferase n=1 Tax=Clunio marinus TaxID=568069 RepID=A0A1J1HU62_9DIPT|nr:CLUMA_CG005200, isoform A [Clunio marinus]